jgi:hypothetical protein
MGGAEMWRRRALDGCRTRARTIGWPQLSRTSASPDNMRFCRFERHSTVYSCVLTAKMIGYQQLSLMGDKSVRV